MVSKKYITISLLVFSFFLFVSSAKAFRISPTKMIVTMDANTSQTVRLGVRNTETKDYIFKFGVLGMIQEENGDPIFGRGVTEAEGWVFPEEASKLIRVGAEESINFIIKVPEKIVPGSYYVGLFAEPSLVGNVQSQAGARLISLLTVQVAGQVYEDVIVQNWKANDRLVADSNKKKWDFDLTIKNTGPVEVPLKGVITIKNWRGQDVFSEDISLGNKLIANSVRSISPSVLVENKITWPGLYQAQMRVQYGLTGQKVSSITSVWYLPIWSMVVLGLLGLLLVLIIYRLAKIRRK